MTWGAILAIVTSIGLTGVASRFSIVPRSIFAERNVPPGATAYPMPRRKRRGLREHLPDLLDDELSRASLTNENSSHNHRALDHHLGVLIDAHQIEAVVEEGNDDHPDQCSMNPADAAR
jgi:hypothetical protein